MVPLSMPLSETSTPKADAVNCAWVKPFPASHARYPGPVGTFPERLPETSIAWRSSTLVGSTYGWIETTSGRAASEIASAAAQCTTRFT